MVQLLHDYFFIDIYLNFNVSCQKQNQSYNYYYKMCYTEIYLIKAAAKIILFRNQKS